MANFNPCDPNKMSLDWLLPKGEYDFKVGKAEETFSKNSGAEMLKLKLSVFHGDRTVTLFDYILFTEKHMPKLYSFCQSIGIEDKYHSGSVTPFDVEGRSGKVIIKIDDKDEQYEPKNAVARYKKSSQLSEIPSPSKANEDDDIPF